MESKRPKPGTAAAVVGLELADKQIVSLSKSYLPTCPHLLYVPTSTPYLPRFPFENQNTPFDPTEVMHLQYMTMISNPDRGVGRTRGDWQEDLTTNGKSPWSAGGRSNTTTPNPFKDSRKPAVKMSIADYKSLKQSGVKPSPKPTAGTPYPDPQHKFGHSRNTSAMSAGTPMTRVSSLEGPADVKPNGASVLVNSARLEVLPPKDVERPPVRPSNTSDTREKPRATTNGHVEHPARDAPQSKERNKDPPRPEYTQITKPPPLKHALPPRPQSPPKRNSLGLKQKAPQKRPNLSNDTPPEKRTKIEHTRIPSNSQIPLNPLPRRPDTPSQVKAPSAKPQKSTPTSQPSQPSPLPKEVPVIKSIETKNSAKSEKPRDLPPLLSPLPADLESDPLSQPPKSFAASSFSNTKKQEASRNAASSPPIKPKIGSDTIVVKGPPESSPLSTPPKSSARSRARSPLILPRLLSPELPDIVEQALAELQKKKNTPHRLDTVEARHEKARQPDAPGVARKTIKPRGGQPKKTVAESSKDQPSKKTAEEECKDQIRATFIVKIPYKKRQANDIARILRIRSRPNLTFLGLEAERNAQEERKKALQPSALLKNDDSSDDEGPIVKSKPKSIAPANKKRPGESSASEPAPKRTKLLENLDVIKSHAPVAAAIKSPAVSGPSQKTLLTTPKKGDAMKSVAMRKVDSSDGHARTPQSASTSTPASAEKSRMNGSVEPRSQPHSAEVEKFRADNLKYADLAIKLKRKMDDLLRIKAKDPQERASLSEKDRKMGLATGIECVVVYMNAFYNNDRLNALTNRPQSPTNWVSVIALWTFIDSAVANYPVFQALSAQLGAICREQLDRVYLETLRENLQDRRIIDLFRENSKAKTLVWKQADKTRGSLKEFGGDEVLGPWSEVRTVTAFVIGVLTAYSRKEQTGWKRDPGL